MKLNFSALAACLSLALVGLAGCGKTEQAPTAGAGSDKAAEAKETAKPAKKPKLAYVTNGVDPFWDNAAAGVKAAAKEFNAECEVLMPPNGLVDQKRMIETVLARGIDGIAISPIDAKNQVGMIDEAASHTHVITHDSDAPDSKREYFIGMNNYKAGRDAGKLVKEALPQGGKVMLFVGRLEQLNAQQRRQGVVDELLDKPEQSLETIQYDAPGKQLAGAKYTILDTRTDNFDYSKAKANAEDAMTANPELACMVGLFAYNTPNCKEAVKEAGKLGKIKLVGFDEAEATLQGIADGSVYGTISQQPDQYGYHSVRILAALARGEKAGLPQGKFVEVPSISVRKDNLEAFQAKLKKLRSGG